MPSLDCSVNTCAFNAQHCCCKNEINVNGSAADKTAETCCSSFKKQNGEMKDSVSDPKTFLSIGCDAEKCAYNKDRICNADHIDISGSSADHSEQTLCSTFTCQA